jgi:hypothetical protein
MGVGSYLLAEFVTANARLFVLEAKGPRDPRSEQFDAATTRLATSRLLYDGWWREDEQQRLKGDGVSTAFEWSRDWFDAELAMNTKSADRIASAEKYLERTKKLEKLVGESFKLDKVPQLDVDEAAFFRADAEFLLLKTKPDTKASQASAKAAKARLEAAKKVGEARLESFLNGKSNFEGVCNWSVTWRNAAMDVATTKDERVNAAEDHLKRMQEVEKVLRQLVEARRTSEWYRWGAAYMVADAEIFLAEVRRK